jgi:hypothetical protein
MEKSALDLTIIIITFIVHEYYMCKVPGFTVTANMERGCGMVQIAKKCEQMI